MLCVIGQEHLFKTKSGANYLIAPVRESGSRVALVLKKQLKQALLNSWFPTWTLLPTGVILNL